MTEKARSAEVATVVEVATEDSSAALAVAPEDTRQAMSRDEAEQRFLVALVTRAISDDQVRVLLNARIEDADGYEGVGIEQFTPQEMEDLVTLMLEENPTLLNDVLQQIRDGRAADVARLQPPRRLDEPPPRTIGE